MAIFANPPPPPPHLEPEEEEALWREIVAEFDFRGVGHSLALHCFSRATQCQGQIAKDGGVYLITERGMLKKHPLASLEVSNHKLGIAIFKQLKIPV